MLKPSGSNLKKVQVLYGTLSNSAKGLLLLSVVNSLQQTSFTRKLTQKLGKQQKITRGISQRDREPRLQEGEPVQGTQHRCTCQSIITAGRGMGREKVAAGVSEWSFRAFQGVKTLGHSLGF